ncbi:hypothetical protein J3F84DRAFT_229817 [Trichoderma pleuroticola]
MSRRGHVLNLQPHKRKEERSKKKSLICFAMPCFVFSVHLWRHHSYVGGVWLVSGSCPVFWFPLHPSTCYSLYLQLSRYKKNMVCRKEEKYYAPAPFVIRYKKQQQKRPSNQLSTSIISNMPL